MSGSEGSVDPRVVRTRRDVLESARAVLVEEGWERVTLARVAERSGYARTTLYRHWPKRLDLLRDLISSEAQLVHITATGNLREDLVAELDAFRCALTETVFGRAVIAIGQQAREDPEVAELNRSLRHAGGVVVEEVLQAAAGRGEIDGNASIDVLVTMLTGPVVFRYLFEQSRDLDHAFVAQVVDQVLAGVRTQPSL